MTPPPVSRRAKRHADAAQRLRGDQQYVSARAEAQRALSIIDRGPPFWSSPLTRLRWAHARADLHAGLGEISLELGRPDLARDEFGQALREYAELSHPESADTSTMLNNLGVAYEKLGLLGESEAVLRRAMEIDRRTGRPSDSIAANLNNIALTLQSAGYLDDAARALERASRLAGLPPGTVERLEQQRSFHQLTRGEYAEALVTIAAQLEAAESDSIEAAHLAGDLAQAYAELQRNDEAERLQRRVVDIRRRRQPGSLPLAISLSNLAMTLDAGGRCAQGEACLREAIELAERIAPQSGALAAMRGSLAWSLFDRGRPAEAAALAAYAITSAPAANRQLAGVRLVAALAYAELDDPRRARAMLEDARDACARVSPLLPELRPILTALGWHLYRGGERDAAAKSFDDAIAVAESRRAGAAEEPGLELLFGTAKSAYHGRILLAWECGDAEAAFRAAESFRARTLAELLSAAESPRQTAPAATQVVADLDGVRHRLGALYRRLEVDPSRELEDRRDTLEQQAERLRVRLRALAPGVADRQYPGPCTVAEIQSCLDATTLLALYEVTDDGVFLVTVRQDAVELARLEPESDALAAAVDEVLAACRVIGSPVPEAALDKLGEWLLRPLSGGFDKLIVCANDILSYLPFEALPLDGTALAERAVVWSVPSTTTLVRFGQDRRRHRAAREFAGFAVSRTPGAADLPSAEPEVRAIAALFPGGSTVTVNEQVTAATVRTQAEQARFVHFAMHGEITDTRPLYSGFPLSDGEFLHAYEMSALDLRADLVTCSACQTAVGESHAGEGTVGLAYALFAAGARAVLVSRWPIADPVARRLMVAVYRELAAGTPAAFAVRKAALGLRKTQRHPREWAAFTLIDIGRTGST
jgi:tetratricopeptide (TPR) repeat protein